MTQELTHHCLLLAPIPAIEAANQAAIQVTGLAASANTFSDQNIMLMGGVEYACAGVYVTSDEYANLAPFATDLGGYYYLLKINDGTGWRSVQPLDECMDANGITRPEIEEEI